MRHSLTLPAGLIVLILAAAEARAQDAGQEKYVTKEEYDKLKKDLEAMKAQIQDLKKKGASEQELQQQIDELEKELKATKAQVQDQKPGETRFLLTGYGFAGFTATEREASTFSAGFNPIFLWRPMDRILFEAELEIELEDTDTHVGLEYAQLSYLLNDYVTIGAGRFLTPFGTFDERLHPKWINKLPDRPLAFDDGGLSPEATIGLEIRGGIPIEPIRMNYAIYVGNSPRLETDITGAIDDVGKLFDDNFSGLTHRKSVGGRLGFLPIPELEIGYSILFGRVGDQGDSLSNHVNALLQGVDLSYVRETDLIKGTVMVFGQWAWSHVDRATYIDPTGVTPPVTPFSNRRQGGYLQISYRPSKIDVDILKNFELVARYDVLNQPREAPTSVDDRRWTLGLDYWVTASMVVKVAYQWDKRDDPADPSNRNVHAFMAQIALGF